MTYPGNTSLSPDVQQRILTTYRQSLQSAARGNRDEALLGCDFVQRLDPQFQPARVLQQMLAANREPEVFAQMLDALDGGGGGEGDGEEDLRALFARLLAERRFPEILNAAERDKRRVAADPELLSLVEAAQGRHEAEPYVTRFLGEAAAALAEQRREDVARLLDKARALDASHPGIAEIESLLHPGAAPAGEAADATVALPDLDFDAFQLPSPDEAGLGFDTPDLSAPSFDTPDFAAATLEPGGAEEARPAEETSGRIVSLLAEGQEAFDRGDFQPAIDAWSRIFLIDIDHEEAARKIERARQLKSEQEREVEEIFHDGVARFDAGELAASRAAFQKVLELQPSYALAREYLDKLDERESGVELPGGGLPELAPLAPAAAPAAEPRRPSGELSVPPPEAPRRDRGRAPVGQGYVATAKKGGGAPSPRFLLIGGGVLALLAVGGWFLFSQRERLFPNAEPAATSAEPAQADPLARAQELHAAGKTPNAVAMLRRIPGTDPRYAEAQSLISQWEKIPAPEEAATGDPLLAARRRALLEQGQAALEAGENFRARRLFTRAAELAPLDGDWITLSTTAEERLAPLASEVRQFTDGDYEFLINALWRRREAEPDNRDLQRMLVDAYHNLGVLDLQRGDAASAREKFREARLIDPADPAIQRLERFAVLYEQRGPDLLYRIFVKYAPLR